MPEKEAYSSRDINVYLNSLMEVLVFALMFGAIYTLIKYLVVKKIQSVNRSLSKIIDGDLNETVKVNSSEEFVSLSSDINSTVSTLKHYIDEAAARIDKELAFAKEIQLSALPSVFPPYPKIKHFDVYATMQPARDVGGDFYDFYMVDKSKVAFLIADVSGKGIPAAMFMMTAKTMIKNLAETGSDVDEVFTKSNAKLCESNDAGMFVTAWMGVLDYHTGHVTFCNAGHNPPLLYRKGKGYEYIKEKPGFVLAGMDGLKYKAQEFDLEPGDRIFLYTDGATEATNTDKELFGEDRLLKSLDSDPQLPLKDAVAHVKQDIDAFVGEAEQFDDITMLILEFRSGKGTEDP